MTLDPRLLEILVCPACSGRVHAVDDHTALRCEGCERSFPVRDGIPAMLVDDASDPEGTEPTG